ncbi:MAG: hypothetical protein KDK66_04185 [Deltaproteobacteria bacterium]|nr:hypothetical protein [Deltaproteobacteria bacterium]
MADFSLNKLLETGLNLAKEGTDLWHHTRESADEHLGIEEGSVIDSFLDTLEDYSPLNLAQKALQPVSEDFKIRLSFSADTLPRLYKLDAEKSKKITKSNSDKSRIEENTAENTQTKPADQKPEEEDGSILGTLLKVGAAVGVAGGIYLAGKALLAGTLAGGVSLGLRVLVAELAATGGVTLGTTAAAGSAAGTTTLSTTTTTLLSQAGQATSGLVQGASRAVVGALRLILPTTPTTIGITIAGASAPLAGEATWTLIDYLTEAVCQETRGDLAEGIGAGNSAMNTLPRPSLFQIMQRDGLLNKQTLNKLSGLEDGPRRLEILREALSPDALANLESNKIYEYVKTAEALKKIGEADTANYLANTIMDSLNHPDCPLSTDEKGQVFADCLRIRSRL